MAVLRFLAADKVCSRDPLVFSSWQGALEPRSNVALPGFALRCKLPRTSQRCSFVCSPFPVAANKRRVAVFARTGLQEASISSVELQTKSWIWRRPERNVNIFYEEHVGREGSAGPLQNILLLPTISDVSTTEEWRNVAVNLLKQNPSRWRIVIVDWPGFGLSDRPRMEYTAEVMEVFLTDFINAGDGPLSASDNPPIVVGAGHAATLAMRAVNKNLVKAKAIAAVAPTWAGPMPIVFGREPNMESRYSLLRNSLQAPAVGWMMYNFMVSSPDNIRKQYLSHVYADPNNVTPNLLDSRLALTKREGARYAPAAFLTGLLDPVKSRDEFLSLVADLEGAVPLLVLSASQAPRRSKAEMEILKGAKGVSKFVQVEGALLPQEEYPDQISKVLFGFLIDM